MLKYSRKINKLTGEKAIVNNKTGEVTRESENPALYAYLRKKALASESRKAKDDLMKDLGMTKVYGAVSGKVYYE